MEDDAVVNENGKPAMDASTLIARIQEFLEKNYYAQLLDKVRKGDKSMSVEFNSLSAFDPELADYLLDQPEEFLKGAEIAVEQLNLGPNVKNFILRIRKVPPSSCILVRNIRSIHLNRMLAFDGVVRNKSEVRPQVVTAKFECPSCGNNLPVLQLDNKFQEPTRCSCGRKGKFKLVSKELVDAQMMVLEEVPEQLEGGEQPKRMNVLLKSDLVSPLTEKRTNPGARVQVVGLVKEVPIFLRTGGQSTKFDLFIDSNNLEPINEDYSEINISPEELKEIKDLSRDPNLLKKIVSSMAPSIYGHEKIKEALALQLMGGVRKVRDDGVITRGDIHMLFVGDPGAAKSQLLKRMQHVAPKARYVTGKGASLDYQEPLLIRKNGIMQTVAIGAFVDENYIPQAENLMVPLIEPVETLALNQATCKLEWKLIKYVYRHKTVEKLIKFTLETGRQVSVTSDHSLFILDNGKPAVKPAKELLVKDCVLIPRNIKHSPIHQVSREAARLLGYYIAEGHARCSDSSYKIEFTLHKNEHELIHDIDHCSQIALGEKALVYTHGENGARVVIYGKKAYQLFAFLLGNVLGKKAKEKRVPLCIMNGTQDVQKEFIKAYIAGDAGVTKSRLLASDVLYLYNQQGIIASIQEREDTKETVIRGRTIHSTGKRYDLKSPKKGKEYEGRYNYPPFEALPKATVHSFFREAKSSGYSRAAPDRAENNLLKARLLRVARSPCFGKEFRATFGECTLEYAKDHKDLFTMQKQGRQVLINITPEGKEILVGLEQVELLVNSDIGFARIKKIEQVESSSEFVYDVSVPGFESFVGGFGGVICHNSGAGLSAAVVKDEFLQGWSLEAGALVLANKGLCCTTGNAKFIREDGIQMTFEELFKNAESNLLHPEFKVLGVDEKTLKVKPFSIKQAIRVKNDKKVLKIKTRTGRELNLTQDNEVLTIENSQVVWKSVDLIREGDFVAVPKRLLLETKDKHVEDFAYVCGLIATEGHVSLKKKNALTAFYNTEEKLVSLFKEKMDLLGFKHATVIQKEGRKSIICGKEVISKKRCFVTYNCRKEFAKKLVDFGVPSGNKSIKYALQDKMATYSETTLQAFMRGIFDGDGSIRHNPNEITLTTGILENAKLFQTILLRLGIISSVERSTRSWHCSIRGTSSCLDWFKKIGTDHPEKAQKFAALEFEEVKDRVDILPNHQEFFKQLMQNQSGRLGKSVFKYIWNYARKNVAPSKNKLRILNNHLNNNYLRKHTDSDVLWDEIVSINKIEAEVVYDFTMTGTNNFIANNIVMHNCIDEMDKMSKEDGWAMHEALEQQSVTISKANIQASLRCETTVLAAANPKFGRFDPYDTIANQINLAPTLINRFDLIFPIKDIPDATKDERMAKFILSMHKNNVGKPDIETKMLRKYFAFGRQNISPKLTDAAIEELQEYYMKMRASAGSAGVKSVPISARQLEGLVRLAEASARLRLSDKVLKRDAKKAVELLDYCMRQIAFDEKSGTFDIDRIATDMPASTRNKLITMKEIIQALEAQVGKTIPVDDVIKAAADKDITEGEAEEILQKLKRAGDIFEPRKGFVSRI